MNILPFEDYPCLRTLFQEPHVSFVIEAMIAGNSPSLVWTDLPDAPRSAFIWDKTHCLYLAGDAGNMQFHNAARQILAERILPEGQARQLHVFKLYTSGTAWGQVINSIFVNEALTQRERVLLTLTNSDTARMIAPLPDEFCLERITPEHLTADLENASELAAEIDSCWSARERLFQHGVGYCAVREGREITGWCTTEYCSKGQCGIGIETIEAYMNRGIATRVGQAVIAECLARQMKVYWDSWTTNLPSLAVAKKLGFQEKQRYSVWFGQFQAHSANALFVCYDRGKRSSVTMSQEQADRAIEQLYADASARDELTDDEAKVLLKWGEEQIHKLAAQNLDDVQFDEALAHLSKLLTRVNRFTARRADLMPEEQQESVNRIAVSAQALAGYIPSAQAVAQPSFDTYLQQQSSLDNIANIQALTTLIAPGATAEAAPPETPNPTVPAETATEPAETHQALTTSGTSAIIRFEQPTTPDSAQPSTGEHNGETQQ